MAFGTLVNTCVAAAKKLRDDGLHIGVINARFVKPLDRELILRAVETLPVVVTVEEGTLEGGFGSAVLEAANAAGLDTQRHPPRCAGPVRRARGPGRCWPSWIWTPTGWPTRYGDFGKSPGSGTA